MFQDILVIAGGIGQRKSPWIETSQANNCDSSQLITEGCKKIDSCTIDNSLLRWYSVGGVIGNQMVICGGEDENGSLKDDCHILGHVKPFTTMTIARFDASAVVLQGELWITGGLCKLQVATYVLYT